MNLPSRISIALFIYIFLNISAFAQQSEGALVAIGGEVAFPGQYVCQGRQMTAADLIRDAGGLTGDAYEAGVGLYRQMSDEQYERMVLACQLAQEQLDIFKVKIQVPSRSDRYSVPLDSFLIPGDEVVVPKHASTVSIYGAVQYPTVVVYSPEKTIDDYIRLAGGYSRDAARSKVFVLSPDGEKLKKKAAKILAGSEICVPSRIKSSENAIFAEEIISICTSTNSVTEMVIEIVDKINKR